MACGWQMMVTMVRMLMMLRVSPVMHYHEIQEAQIWLGLPMLPKMLRQLNQSG